MKHLIFILSVLIISCGAPTTQTEIVTVIEKIYTPPIEKSIEDRDDLPYSSTGATFTLVLQSELGSVVLFTATKAQYDSFSQWDRGVLVTDNKLRIQVLMLSENPASL